MEIENKGIAALTTAVSGPGAGVENPRNQDRTEARQPAGTTGHSDQVSLTSQARQLREIGAQLAEQPVVDPQRVEAVRSAIDDGTFTVNAQRIADKMISLEQALVGAR
jgi:negative regulator of flagellin synthesis FlgM